MTSPNCNGQTSPVLYNQHVNASIESSEPRIHHGRRIRRCNWIRFLTVYEKEFNQGCQYNRNENSDYKDLNTQINAVKNKLHPNVECRLTESGQVIYEVLEPLEPSTELIVQFKHLNNYALNNNNEEFDKSIKDNEDCSQEVLGIPFDGILQYPRNMNIFCSSHLIANMLLIDAISGIIQGMYM
jgi:hypothetical protein